MSHFRKNSARYFVRYIGLLAKYPFFLSHFNRTWIFSTNLCFNFLYKFLWNMSHFRKNSARYFIRLHRSSCKIIFNQTRIFPTDVLKASTFMKIHPSEAELFPCGRTEMTRLVVTFRNIGNAPKKKWVNSSGVLQCAYISYLLSRLCKTQ
jgi:hypothetical protein